MNCRDGGCFGDTKTISYNIYTAKILIIIDRRTQKTFIFFSSFSRRQHVIPTISIEGFRFV